MSDKVKPTCKLSGTDGNVFAVIANVSRCLKKEGLDDYAKEWVNGAMSCESYNDVLRLAFEYVNVE